MLHPQSIVVVVSRVEEIPAEAKKLDVIGDDGRYSELLVQLSKLPDGSDNDVCPEDGERELAQALVDVRQRPEHSVGFFVIQVAVP